MTHQPGVYVPLRALFLVVSKMHGKRNIHEARCAPCTFHFVCILNTLMTGVKLQFPVSLHYLYTC